MKGASIVWKGLPPRPRKMNECESGLGDRNDVSLTAQVAPPEGPFVGFELEAMTREGLVLGNGEEAS